MTTWQDEQVNVHELQASSPLAHELHCRLARFFRTHELWLGQVGAHKSSQVAAATLEPQRPAGSPSQDVSLSSSALDMVTCRI